MSDKDLILLAMKDPGEMETFAGFLKGREIETLEVSDGSVVMETAIKEKPSMLIIDYDLPGKDGQQILQSFRANPETSEIPFMFLGAVTRDVKGFRSESDKFITRPFNWEELFASIKQSLASAQDSAGKDAEKEIAGDLSQISLVDILQMLHFNQKEGELLISSGDHEGTVFMKGGQVINCTLGQIEKEKALFRLFSWKNGTFEFKQKSVSIPERISSPTGNLLMEGMRQLDELEKSRPSFPDSNTTLKLEVNTAELPKGLKPLIYEILSLVDYYPRVGELVDHSTATDLDTYEVLMTLLGREILVAIKGDEDTGGKRREEFILPQLAVKFKEQVVQRGGDMLKANYAKIFIASPTPDLLKDFTSACASIHDFLPSSRPASKEKDYGRLGTLEIYGGMKVAFIDIPADTSLAPLRKAFSANLTGLFLIWDEASAKSKEIVASFTSLSKEVRSIKDVPVIHLFSGDAPSDEISGSIVTSEKEHLYSFKPASPETVSEIVKTFFNVLVEEEYTCS